MSWNGLAEPHDFGEVEGYLVSCQAFQFTLLKSRHQPILRAEINDGRFRVSEIQFHDKVIYAII